MQVADMLTRKGTTVATVPPDATVSEVITRLADRGVGALVVTADGTSITGIVSERDVVRQLAVDGVALLDRPVEEIMTVEVITCSITDRADALLTLMTQRRIRHVPVTDDADALIGIISIGDVVKSRVDELEDETRVLEGYIKNSW